MKYTFALITSFLIIGNLFSQEFDGPVQYFDYLNQQHGQLIMKNLDYVQHSVHSEDLQEIETKRIDVINQLGEAILKVGTIPTYKTDTNMKQELLAVLKVYLESFEMEYSELNLLKSKSSESYEAMEEYLNAQDAAEKKLAAAADRYQKAQKEFAKNNNIRLLEAEENSEINQINQVNAYYRVVFMKYFRVSKLNASFTDAMNEKDTQNMEKIRVQLLNASKEELKKLQLFPDFKGNTSFREAGKDILIFYRDLAETRYKKMVNILKKNDLNQADVDAYNETINHINNNTGQLINKYNETLNELLRSNVPKPAIATKRI